MIIRALRQIYSCSSWGPTQKRASQAHPQWYRPASPKASGFSSQTTLTVAKEESPPLLEVISALAGFGGQCDSEKYTNKTDHQGAGGDQQEQRVGNEWRKFSCRKENICAWSFIFSCTRIVYFPLVRGK